MKINFELLQDEIYNHLIGEAHKSIMETVNDELGIESTIVSDHWNKDEDTGAVLMDRKLFKFYGSGCGIVWIDYDKRSKIATEIIKSGVIREAINRYRRYVMDNEFTAQDKVKYELAACLGQNMCINVAMMDHALDYVTNKYDIKRMYVRSRID